MTLNLQQIHDILTKEHLLKEFIIENNWTLTIEDNRDFSALSYDSRNVSAETLFFCKGLNFKEEYLVSAVAHGLDAYVAEQPYTTTAAIAIIVTDVKKALAVLAMAFFDYPQEKLKIIGITGTKGKTTTAYFAKTILAHATGNKVAFFSSEEYSVDGVTNLASSLSTPESLEIYTRMDQAVKCGMTHLVLEVSSQAYKVDRVYGLTYDCGIFLNIGMDHVGPIEHPTFEDYLYCKRQLIVNSKQVILNRDNDYFDLLAETAAANGVPIMTYGRQNADYLVASSMIKPLHFSVTGAASDPLHVNGNYDLQIPGEFNHENATAALLATVLMGADKAAAKVGLAETFVPGRLNMLTRGDGLRIFIDYAHNYLSMHAVFELAKEMKPNARLIVVTGSAGDKAQSRRKDIGKALGEGADIAILTADDPNHEDPKTIADEIYAGIQNEQVHVIFEMDRVKAIETSLELATADDFVIIAGKGNESTIKYDGKNVPYEGDFYIAKRLAKI
jgi:UDP-N-acetylmuramoyl-L-alanyl-D-glutamate-L-lysine ligase